MPQGKSRRKDDTWTTEDLTEALNKGGKGDDRKKRPKDDDDRKERRRRDEVNGDDSRRRHKDDDKKSSKRDEGEERERQRQERREKRGGDSKRKEERVKEEKPVDSEEDTKRRHKREESDRRRRHDDEDDGDRRRRHEESGERRQRDKKESSRHKEKDAEVVVDDEAGGGRKDREHRSKDEDRKERHKDREERHKDERHKDRDKDRDREERHKERDRDRDDRKRRDRDKETPEEREERKQREREERRREKEKEEQRRKEEEEKKKKEEASSKGRGDADDYNEYEDDFEDYEDDFEDDEDMDEEGEMEAVLRALDEENARLTSLSHRSNWSDSTELSDERFKAGEEPLEPGQEPPPDRGENRPNRARPFINFVSAKQRVLNHSQASKARRRANDLKNMIELDTVYYDLFDLPPVREYELYIRSFGRSNTKQAYVQTNEDAVERDVQTEEIDDLDKWTQHPADDLAGVGGDGITVVSAATEDRSIAHNPEAMARVGKFLERAAQMINIVLEEERTSEEGGGHRREKTSSLSVSDGYSQLSCPSFLAGRYVQRVCFCPMQPNMFLTLYSKPEEPSGENLLDIYGVICVWNVKEMASPQKILISLSQPTCACFSPSRAALVIAGMVDGSVMLWDLREPSSLHRSMVVDGQEIVLRSSTYNTAGVLEKENHLSPVMSITAVHPTVLRNETKPGSSDTEGKGLSFQLASVEENATVNLWVVTEIAAPDMAGSEADLGLAPGGRVKLLRSSAVTLNTSNKSLRCLDIQLNPSDLNHFFVGTDLGQIIHGVRFGSRVFPRIFEPEIESPQQVNSLDFSPFGEPYFLASCEDGAVHLYHTTHKHPLASWPTFTQGNSIVSVQWSRSRPAVFFVLDSNSVLYTFDLVETGLGPISADTISSGRATAMMVSNDPALMGGSKHLPTHMLISLDNGSSELHTVKSSYRQQQPLETEFLSHYMERY